MALNCFSKPHSQALYAVASIVEQISTIGQLKANVFFVKEAIKIALS